MSELVSNPAAHRRHFHTFDALRFFAVCKVFIQHLPIESFAWFNYIKAGGHIGVQFFFVLSGFLITYIICTEKEQTDTLNLKNFFVRRVLRIWPLFYLVIALCYGLPVVLKGLGMSLSGVGYQPQLWMSLLFLENYKMIATDALPNIFPLAVTWSLCIEEHFYIAWGLLLYVFPIKHLPKLIVCCLLFAPAARFLFIQNDLDPSDLLTHIDLFAYGAIPAYLLVKREHWLTSMANRIPRAIQLGYVFFVMATVLLLSQSDHPVVNTAVFGILFSALLTLTLPVHAALKIRERNIFNRLGIYTYGIYLYHLFVIIGCNKLFLHFSLSLAEPLWAMVFCLLSLLLTLGISYLSYQYFEKPFLKLKRKFRTKDQGIKKGSNY